MEHKERLNELALFAGAGGGILGGLLGECKTVCAVEIDAYCAGVLIQRQNDGILAPFPVWDDVCTFDGRPWRGIVDVVSGGFPCQDISAAGKGEGIKGEKSGLWLEMARIIGEVRPRYVFVENSPMLTSRGLGKVLGDLAKMGFDARWGVISAADVGAPHLRERIWIVGGRQGECNTDASRFVTNRQADTRQRIEFGEIRTGIQQGWNEIRDSNRKGESVGAQYDEASWMQEYVADPSKTGLQSALQGGFGKKYAESTSGGWWETEPGMGRVVDGLAHRLDRIKALGNGQVPAVAAEAWQLLI